MLIMIIPLEQVYSHYPRNGSPPSADSYDKINVNNALRQPERSTTGKQFADRIEGPSKAKKGRAARCHDGADTRRG